MPATRPVVAALNQADTSTVSPCDTGRPSVRMDAAAHEQAEVADVLLAVTASDPVPV